MSGNRRCAIRLSLFFGHDEAQCPTKPVWVAKEGTSALRENVGESVVDEGLTLVERKGQRSVQRPEANVVLGKK